MYIPLERIWERLNFNREKNVKIKQNKKIHNFQVTVGLSFLRWLAALKFCAMRDDIGREYFILLYVI